MLKHGKRSTLSFPRGRAPEAPRLCRTRCGKRIDSSRNCTRHAGIVPVKSNRQISLSQQRNDRRDRGDGMLSLAKDTRNPGLRDFMHFRSPHCLTADFRSPASTFVESAAAFPDWGRGFTFARCLDQRLNVLTGLTELRPRSLPSRSGHRAHA
jgi:hypothetical protein